MPKSPRLIGYYLFFIVLLVATGGALGLTLSKSSDAKADSATSAAMVQITSKLSTYVTNQKQVPVSLDDAGVNNLPASVTYTKLNDSQYKICAYYKSSGAGVSLPVELLALTHPGSPSYSSSDLDVYSLAYGYKAGQNCQTVSPSSLGSNLKDLQTAQNSALQAVNSQSKSQLQSAKCGNNGAAFELKDETTVQSVDPGQGVLVLSVTGAKLSDKNSQPVSSLGAIKYDSLTAAYATADCKKLTTKDIDSIKTGAGITVYLYSHSSAYADQLEF